MQTTSPYNRTNSPISTKTVQNILNKFNCTITVKNLSIYQRALTHTSYVKSEYDLKMLDVEKQKLIENRINFVDLQDKSNEVLELLGDNVIKCIITSYIINRYYDQNEGFLTILKTRLEDTKSLAKYSRRMNLGYNMLISKQVEDNNGRDSEKLLEDIFESFFGALYTDQGFGICQKLLINFLETEIDYAEILHRNINYKTMLLRFYHDNKWSHPEYVDIECEKINGKKLYTMGVLNHLGEIITQATDTSKKKAEQSASKLALIKFGQHDEDDIDE